MKKRIFSVWLVICFWLSSAWTTFFQYGIEIPLGWPKPTYDFIQHPLSPAQIELGRALFYDPILSRDQTISCASCHLQSTAFAHTDHALSHGIEDRIGLRNAPALVNLAWSTSFMWDGAIHHLEAQALAPIHHPDEMGSSLAEVVKKLQQSPLYRSLVQQAYSDTIVTGERVLKSIAQFMLTLVSSDAKYDQVRRKAASFTPQEANGYLLFKQHCNACHTEPLFTNHSFANNGLRVDSILKDGGRIKVTQKKEDSLKFKVPTLRNIEFSYPYMHDGRFKRLNQVIEHYTSGIQAYPNLAPELRKPIVLTAHEKVDLLAFLLTLTDKTFLFNPKYAFPKTIFFPTKDN